jgi:ribokinase
VPADGLPADLLAKLDVLVVNETEAGMLSGTKVTDDTTAEAAARRLQDMGAKRIALTLGARGALALDDECVFVPARKVEVVDTVGAGDAFCGALVTGLSEGFDFTEAVKFASAAAGLACTRIGAQASLPARTDIESLWRS